MWRSPQLICRKQLQHTCNLFFSLFQFARKVRGEGSRFVLDIFFTYPVTFLPFLLAITLSIQCELYRIRSQNIQAVCAVLVGGLIMPSLKKKNKQKKKKHDAKVGK
jgi:hypothetical protein